MVHQQCQSVKKLSKRPKDWQAMAPGLGSYSQPQVTAHRPPLAERTDSATNRQLSTPHKALSERKTPGVVLLQPPITPEIIISTTAPNGTIASSGPSTSAIGIATPDNDLPPSTSTHQLSVVPDRPAPPIQNAQIPHHESLASKRGHEPTKSKDTNCQKKKATEKDPVTAVLEEKQRKDNLWSGFITKRGKRNIGPWQLGKDLGSGATGRVRLARHRVTGHLVAMKIVTRSAAAAMQSQSLMDMGNDLSTTRPGQREIPVGIEREVIMMRLLDHPNVIKLYDVWENRGELYLVMEFVEGGELYNYIRECHRLKEGEAVRIFRQIISGLAHLHRYNICHRDLKPENILLDEQGNVKIVDFGMAALQPGNAHLFTHCGSPHYAAPEIARSLPYHGTLADVWSVGVILYVMLNGHMPFSSYKPDEKTADVLEAVMKGEVRFPDWNSYEAVDLMKRIFQGQPEDRITLTDMWRHPLLKKWESVANHPKSKRIWLGGPPVPLTEDECGKPIRRREEVDEEIMRNLKIMCHSIEMDDIWECVLESEPNIAKVLYQCLVKYREEQLEFYNGPPLPTTKSDYHYKMEKPLPRSASRLSSVKTSSHSRRASQFSIPQNASLARQLTRQKSLPSQQSREVSKARTESRQSRQSRQASKAGTEKSYDPYKYTRRPKSAEVEYAKITLLRRSLEESRRLKTPNHASSLRNPAISKFQENVGIPSSPPTFPILNGHDCHGSQSSAKALSRSQSRSSILTSSYHQRSSSRGVRSSMSYKRGVSFNHIRQRSRTDSMPSRAGAPSPDTMLNRYLNDQTTPSEEPSLPALISEQFRDLNDWPDHPARLDHKRRSRDAMKRYSKALDQLKKEDFQQFSSEASELEKMMEETFARTSLTVPTTEGESYHANPQSADTSLSLMNGVAAKLATGDRVIQSPSKAKITGKRALPKPSSSDAQLSDAQAQLIQARDNFMARLNDPNMPAEVINETLITLNRLVQQHIPGAETSSHRRYSIIDLSPVKEESIARDSWRTVLSTPTKRTSGNRIVSEPTRRGNDLVFQRSTIRLVDDDLNAPLSPIKPLNIRKRSDEALNSFTRPRSVGKRVRNSAGTQNSLSQLSAGPSDSRHVLDPFYNAQDRDSYAAKQVRSQHNLAPIRENGPASSKETQNPLQQSPKKASGSTSWFKRNRNNSASTRSSGENAHPRNDNPNWPLREREIADVLQLQQQRRSTPIDGFAPPKAKTSAKEKLMKLFGKKPSSDALFSKATEQRTAFGLAPAGDDGFVDVEEDDEESIYTRSATSRYPPSRAGLRSEATLAGTGGGSRPGSRSMSQQQRPPTRRHRHGNESFEPPTLHPDPASQGFGAEGKAARDAPAQNWLAKFLHIKPASKVLCFQVSRMQARKQMTGVLRSWRRYGMRDVKVERSEGRVWARVGVENSLNIRPVTIRIEVFTVLDRGRHANLSVARVTQEEGAKSSFERVVDSLVRVLETRQLLVQNEKWVKEMKACLG